MLAATPWTARARVATGAGVLAGAVLVVVGALGARGEDSLSEQIAWLNAAMGGLVVAGAASIVWLLAGRRAVTAARNRVVVVYAGDLDIGPVADADVRLAERVTVAGSSWYHRPDCLLTAGKPLLDARAVDGLTPCRVCGA